jgi:hypothetical protein
VHSEVKEKYNNKSRIITNQERNQRINQKINTERLPSRKRGLTPARARKRVTNWNISLVGDPQNLFENL